MVAAQLRFILTKSMKGKKKRKKEMEERRIGKDEGNGTSILRVLDVH